MIVTFRLQDNNNKKASKNMNLTEPAKKKKFFEAGIDSSDEDEAGGVSKTDVAKEVENFMTERLVKSDVDPLTWWSSRLEEYPRLSKLGAKYLAVLPSSTPAERAMSKMDMILNKKRLKMTSSHFAMLMFLSNSSEYSIPLQWNFDFNHNSNQALSSSGPPIAAPH